MNGTTSPGPGFVNQDDTQRKAHQLLDAVDNYQRFEEEELYNQDELPSEVEGYMRELDEEALDQGISPGIVLANEIKDMAMDLEQVVSQYTEQHRPANGQKDWQEISGSYNGNHNFVSEEELQRAHEEGREKPEVVISDWNMDDGTPFMPDNSGRDESVWGDVRSKLGQARKKAAES